MTELFGLKRNIKKGVQAECAARVAACFQIAGVLNSDPLIFVISTLRAQ
jgi:hypothetical protein